MKNIQVWYDLGNLYLQANAFDAALDAYNKAIGLGYQAWDIYKNMAIAFDSQGKIAESVEMYLKSVDLLSENKERAVLFTKLGDSYRKMAEYEKSLDAFKTAIDLDPGNPVLCDGLVELQHDLDKLFEFDLENPLDVISGSPETSDQKGLFSSEGKPLSESSDCVYDEGCTEINSNREDSPHSSLIIEDVVNALQNEDYESVGIAGIDAKVELKTAEEESVRMTMHLAIGVMHWRNEKLEDAVELVQEAILLAAKNKNSWFEALSFHALALIKTSFGDINGAINAYMRAISLAPDKIFPWNNIGTLYGSMDSHDEALSAFQKAIRYNPSDASNWDGLGDIFTKLGRLDDAIAAYQLANIFGKSCKSEDAIKAYQNAYSLYKFTINSANPEIEEELSYPILEVQQAPVNADEDSLPIMQRICGETDDSTVGELKLAKHDISDETSLQTVESENELADSSNQLAGIRQVEDVDLFGHQENELHPVYHSKEENSVFIDEENQQTSSIENVLENGDSADNGLLPIVSSSTLSDNGYSLEKIAGTIASYEAVVRQNPNSDRAWDALGNLYRINQRLEEAINAYEKAVELDSQKYVYHYQLGTLYAANKQYNEAIKEIKKVVELNPSFTFAHCALASYLRKVGLDDDAKHHIALALPFMKNEKEYDRACFESIRGNVEGALELLNIALEKKQTTLEWIRRDLDLDFIRHDPGYSLLEKKYSQSFVNY